MSLDPVALTRVAGRHRDPENPRVGDAPPDRLDDRVHDELVAQVAAVIVTPDGNPCAGLQLLGACLDDGQMGGTGGG